MDEDENFSSRIENTARGSRINQRYDSYSRKTACRVPPLSFSRQMRVPRPIPFGVFLMMTLPRQDARFHTFVVVVP
jgi:hypothetical protein